MAERARIRDVEIKTDGSGRIESVRMVFGPHYFLEVRNASEGVSFAVGATHHGFKADASAVNGQLEQIINEARRSHPDWVVD